jgi:hypothetical protein
MSRSANSGLLTSRPRPIFQSATSAVWGGVAANCFTSEPNTSDRLSLSAPGWEK